ncbi:hypothetical protein [Candidatus Poriferisodalis sp.]|uniref:hypothetical protein n=1 Tax=Candidatus Poriferisodalis sp. TaxID=3101277 RepID=UPI003B02E865
MATNESATTNEAYAPHPDDILPLPWADFHEMYDAAIDSMSHGMEISGRLVIEGRCAYIDSRADYATYTEGPQRLVLSLPRGKFQYDSRSEELWMHHKDRQIEGPIRVGERVSIGGSYASLRSRDCGNEIIVSTPSIWGCRRFPSVNNPLCEIEEYARFHRIQRDEARRRFELFPVLQAAFEELREIESDRVAGWGFDHGLEFAAWFSLTGLESPSETALALANAHDDLEIRTGAETSYNQLLEAQAAFADGQDLHLPFDADVDNIARFELADAVTRSWIDLSEGHLGIGVDTDWVPRQVASALLASEHGSYPDAASVPSHIPNEELLATIERIIAQRLDVPLLVQRALMRR